MVNIQRILCAVDMSDFSRDALHHGVVLAKWYSARLTVLHVYQANQRVMGLPGEAFLSPVDAGQIAHDVQLFCAPLLESSGQSADIVVREGHPAKTIVRECEVLPADLLIVGTHGRSGFERLFLGSVTEKVLRSTPVPVLTIPPPVRQPGSPLYKTILCPLDFSDSSIRALEHALSFAKEADSRLILMHVIEDVFGRAGAEAMRQVSAWDYFENVEKDAVNRLNHAIPDEARVWSRPEQRVVRGRAHQEILKAVADEGVDLVVMGVHGQGAMDRFVFGSTTHRVIREAGCPVLTLHSGH
jgi:nucleotide-binding universal stress UspA family protein